MNGLSPTLVNFLNGGGLPESLTTTVHQGQKSGIGQVSVGSRAWGENANGGELLGTQGFPSRACTGLYNTQEYGKRRETGYRSSSPTDNVRLSTREYGISTNARSKSLQPFDAYQYQQMDAKAMSKGAGSAAQSKVGNAVAQNPLDDMRTDIQELLKKSSMVRNSAIPANRSIVPDPRKRSLDEGENDFIFNNNSNINNNNNNEYNNEISNGLTQFNYSLRSTSNPSERNMVARAMGMNGNNDNMIDISLKQTSVQQQQGQQPSINFINNPAIRTQVTDIGGDDEQPIAKSSIFPGMEKNNSLLSTPEAVKEAMVTRYDTSDYDNITQNEPNAVLNIPMRKDGSRSVSSTSIHDGSIINDNTGVLPISGRQGKISSNAGSSTYVGDINNANVNANINTNIDYMGPSQMIVREVQEQTGNTYDDDNNDTNNINNSQISNTLAGNNRNGKIDINVTNNSSNSSSSSSSRSNINNINNNDMINDFDNTPLVSKQFIEKLQAQHTERLRELTAKSENLLAQKEAEVNELHDKIHELEQKLESGDDMLMMKIKDIQGKNELLINQMKIEHQREVDEYKKTISTYKAQQVAEIEEMKKRELDNVSRIRKWTEDKLIEQKKQKEYEIEEIKKRFTEQLKIIQDKENAKTETLKRTITDLKRNLQLETQTAVKLREQIIANDTKYSAAKIELESELSAAKRSVEIIRRGKEINERQLEMIKNELETSIRQHYEEKYMEYESHNRALTAKIHELEELLAGSEKRRHIQIETAAEDAQRLNSHLTRKHEETSSLSFENSQLKKLLAKRNSEVELLANEVRNLTNELRRVRGL